MAPHLVRAQCTPKRPMDIRSFYFTHTHTHTHYKYRPHCWWFGRTRRKKRTNQYAEEKRWVFSFNVKGEYYYQCEKHFVKVMLIRPLHICAHTIPRSRVHASPYGMWYCATDVGLTRIGQKQQWLKGLKKREKKEELCPHPVTTKVWTHFKDASST